MGSELRFRTFGVVAAAVALLLSTACGSRLSEERIAADARSEIVGGRAATLGSAGESEVTLTDSGEAAAQDGGAPTAGTTPGRRGPVAATGAAASSDAAACTGKEKPIVIGTVGQQSGIAGAAVADGPRAVAAWAAAHNAVGGLNCHQIRYIILDDGGDPSRNQALTQQLVERERAIAIVQSNAPLSMQGSRAYLENKRIPVVGSEGGSDFFYSIPTFFPQVASGNELGYATAAGLAAAITPEQRNNAGFLACLENPTCKAVRENAPAVGMRVVYSGDASITSLDYTSHCNAAKQAGALVFSLGLDPNGISRAAASCRSVNYTPVLSASASVVVPSMAKDPNLEGLLVPSQTKPWTVTDNAAINRLRATLARYAPSVQMSGAAVSGWTSAMLFEAAAPSLGDQPSSADLLEGLYKVRNNDLGGLTGPLTFTAGKPAPRVTCWFSVQIRNGAFMSPDNGQRRCR